MVNHKLQSEIEALNNRGAVHYIIDNKINFGGSMPILGISLKNIKGEINEKVTPDGDMGKEKYRLVVEGPPNYTNFRQFWKMKMEHFGDIFCCFLGAGAAGQEYQCLLIQLHSFQR